MARSLLFRGLILGFFGVIGLGCHRPDADSVSTPSCSANPYLMKYHCSITEIQQAAENGNADAQYALGYMYYYGINTAKDRETATLWIQRAAAQGQPLAKKAWDLIHSGGAGSDFHAAAMQTTPEGKANIIEQQPEESANTLNAQKPTAPLTQHLPAYHSSGNTSENKSQNVALGSLKTWEQNQAIDDADPRLRTQATPILGEGVKTPSPTLAAAPSQSATTQGYTIQLMASHRLPDVVNFIGDHKLANAKYYETQHKGAPWYVLTYGYYPTQQAANTALQALPKTLQQNGPWVKSLQTVKAELHAQKGLA